MPGILWGHLDRPTTCAKLHKVVAEEEKMDPGVIRRAMKARRIVNIDEVMAATTVAGVVDVVRTPSLGDVVVDIRHPDEQYKAPLTLTNNEVISIPFYG